MKKSMFIGMVTVLTVTLSPGIVTLYAGQTDFGMIGQSPGWRQGYAPQQDGGWYAPNNRGWQQRFRDWAYGMMGRGQGTDPDMMGRDRGIGPGMMDRGRGMGSGMMGRSWGMGSGCQ
jgi:hypothetical protein